MKLSVSEIAESSYCERKVILERAHGRAEADEPTLQAGTEAHKVFEHEQECARRAINRSTDSRCFIATHVYGGDAMETQQLRAWRDGSLLPHWYGRAFVRTYYRLSPSVVRLMARCPVLIGPTKAILDRVLRWLA